MREIPLELAGFEGRGLKIIEKGIFSSLELHIDGKRVKIRKFKFIVLDNDGKEAEVRFNGVLFDTGTTVTIRDQTFPIKKPLTWYEYVFSMWPILMLFFGGAIGGGLGGAAACINIALFRSKFHILLKYIFTLIISLSAVILWLALAVMISEKMHLIKG